MPVELIDADGNPIDLEKVDGGTLRSKLEEALAENRTLAQELSTVKAEKILAGMGSTLVKPEDLAGVKLDEIESKAKELHEQREAARVETVRGILTEKGLSGDELEKAVQDFLGGQVQAGNPDPPVDPDFADLLALPGGRPSRSPNAPSLDDGMGNLTAYFEEQEKSSRK